MSAWPDREVRSFVRPMSSTGADPPGRGPWSAGLLTVFLAGHTPSAWAWGRPQVAGSGRCRLGRPVRA